MCIRDSLNISWRLLIIFKIILFADFGPRPGNLDISLIKLSISGRFCINYKGHLNPGTPNPPVALDISSEVFDFNLFFASLCAAVIKS